MNCNIVFREFLLTFVNIFENFWYDWCKVDTIVISYRIMLDKGLLCYWFERELPEAGLAETSLDS